MYVPWRKRMSRLVRGHLRAAGLSRHGIGVLAQTRNGLLALDPRDFGVGRALLEKGSYDWAEITWLSRLLDTGSRLVVVGAHVGAVLVPLAQLSGARHIEVFEPSPANRRLLTANLALNGLDDTVHVHETAIGDHNGTVCFTENPTNTGNSRVAEGGTVQVGLRTLDAALPGRDAIELLLVDTEGFEVNVLRGARQTLERTVHLYIEYAPEQMAEQGSTQEEFLGLVGERFSAMYLDSPQVRFFPDRSYLAYLRSLPPRRGRLMNLLLCNDAQPDARLMNPPLIDEQAGWVGATRA